MKFLSNIALIVCTIVVAACGVLDSEHSATVSTRNGPATISYQHLPPAPSSTPSLSTSTSPASSKPRSLFSRMFHSILHGHFSASIPTTTGRVDFSYTDSVVEAVDHGP